MGLRAVEDIKLRRVLALRWGGALTWVAMLAVLSWVGAPVQPLAAVGVVAASLLTNAGLTGWWRRRDSVPEFAIAGAIGLDIALLVALLAFTGGPMNPFSLFFMVHIAVATVAVGRPAAWTLMALAALGYRLLFWWVPFDHHDHFAMMWHLEGMWWAFALTGGFVLVFLGGLRADLDARAEEQRRIEELEGRNRRLAALATLAGGAAHELATPLGTIAVAAESLRDEAATLGARVLQEDATLVLQQVDRCRRVLQHMAADSGAAMGEVPATVAVRALVSELLVEVDPSRVDVRLPDDVAGLLVHVPVRAMASALRGLVRNALLADAGVVRVTVTLDRRSNDALGGEVVIEVRDHGPGLSPDVLARVGEPFFTTREPGEGMGLGVFLARTVLERAGGSLRLASGVHEGVTATARLPVAEAS